MWLLLLPEDVRCQRSDCVGARRFDRPMPALRYRYGPVIQNRFDCARVPPAYACPLVWANIQLDLSAELMNLTEASCPGRVGPREN